jgi:hypothetical protein
MAESTQERIAYWLRRQRFDPSYSVDVLADEPNKIIPWQFIRFELKTDLAPGAGSTIGTADAYPLVWDGSAYTAQKTYPGTSIASVIKVYDPTNSKRAIGLDNVASGEHGAWGWAVHPMDRGDNDPASDCWEIVEVQRLAVLIRGTGPSSEVAADAEYQLSSPVALDDGQLPVLTDGAMTVTNYSTGLPANAANVTVVADGAGGYRTLDASCP